VVLGGGGEVEEVVRGLSTRVSGGTVRAVH
jgi:hypothetical protein